MAGPVCPHCGRLLKVMGDGQGILGHCSTCNLLVAEVNEANGSRCAPGQAGGDKPPPAELSPLLEVPSLQRGVENDEAARRNRAIRRVFRGAMVGVWLASILGCVALTTKGKGDEGLSVLMVGLYGSPLLGALVATLYALVIFSRDTISGAEELERNARKAISGSQGPLGWNEASTSEQMQPFADTLQAGAEGITQHPKVLPPTGT